MHTLVVDPKNMLISYGNSTKTLRLRTLATPKYEHQNTVWIEDEDVESDLVKPMLSIEKALSFREETEDDLIKSFLNNITLFSLSISQFLENVMQQSYLRVKLANVNYLSDPLAIMAYPTN